LTALINRTGIGALSPGARLMLVLALAGLLAVGVHDVALAATGENAGTNLGNMLKSWAIPLFTGGVILLLVFFFLTAKLTKAIVTLGAALAIAPFVWAPAKLQDLGNGLYQVLTGS